MDLNFKQQFHRDSKSGFTLIETFVAITILLIAVIGPLALVSKSLSDSIFAQNQITAFYLGQEALELVINKVADNELNDEPWLTGLEDCQSESGCTIYWDTDEQDIVVDRCNTNNGCDPLFQDEEGLFNYSDSAFAEETIFARTVVISDSNDLDLNGESVPIDALVTVKMDWYNRSKQQTFSVSTLIYNYFNQNE